MLDDKMKQNMIDMMDYLDSNLSLYVDYMQSAQPGALACEIVSRIDHRYNINFRKPEGMDVVTEDDMATVSDFIRAYITFDECCRPYYLISNALRIIKDMRFYMDNSPEKPLITRYILVPSQDVYVYANGYIEEKETYESLIFFGECLQHPCYGDNMQLNGTNKWAYIDNGEFYFSVDLVTLNDLTDFF